VPPYSHDELTGSCVRCYVCTLLLPVVCAQWLTHAAGPASRVYVSGVWLLVDSLLPCILFARSARHMPVRVGKGREGKGRRESCCWDLISYLFTCQTKIWSVVSLSFATRCTAGRSASASPAQFCWLLEAKFSSPGAGSAQRPLYDSADAADHLLSSISENYVIRLDEMR